MSNPTETWKSEKHGLDVWPDVLRYADAKTPMKEIPNEDLERMKWHGFFYRKRDKPASYMNRIRIPGCELTAEQAREIAYIAYECGYGIVDVTTRGNLQVQGLGIEHVPEVAERLASVGLTSKQTGHDNIRNVFCHPFSGLMPGEIIDARDLCRAVTDLFIDSRAYSDLPRKFNIALNGMEEHSLHYWTQDISFLATRLEDEPLFHVLIGGTQGQNPHLAWHLPVLVRPEQVVEVTGVLLDLFREKGTRKKRNKGRFRYLIETIGVGSVLEYLEEHLDFRLQPCVNEPQPPSGYEDLIGWFRQTDPKRWTMGLCVPLGRMSWQQLEGLAVLSKKWGDGQLRTTPEQGMAVPHIPTGFKDSAATDAAALGLSLHADPLARNTVACTGKQFCNIAVTETKSQMFQLIERLRQRTLMLHGIRIHMSGCPASCAQHHTADIGLKGVRVRRVLGTREGFDVYLGGGIAGRVHLGMPYKLGVDPDQLPQLIEEVVQEYYLKHRAGQTFSAYWRERLREEEAGKVGDEDYTPPTWLCEGCGHHHRGEDPPVYCPKCAGLRRLFARLEDRSPGTTEGSSAGSASGESQGAQRAAEQRSDGFVFVAQEADLSDGEGLSVEAGGRDLALFKVGGEIVCIDGECPHEGAPLGEGDVDEKGVVTCPWHGWTFNACTGCSIDPKGHDVPRYETRIEDGKVFVKVGTAQGETTGEGDNRSWGQSDKGTGRHSSSVCPPGSLPPGRAVRPKTSKAVTANLRVADVVHETPDVRTFRLDNSDGAVPLDYPGRFVKICVPIDGRDVWRSFTICSSPTEAGRLDLTIKRNPAGEVSNFLFENIAAGDSLKIKGPQGGFFFDPDAHDEPLVLISAGSGITPMMSIARFLQATDSNVPCTFLYGARTQADILFHEECLRMAEERETFRYFVTLSQPDEQWTGPAGRLEFGQISEIISDEAACPGQRDGRGGTSLKPRPSQTQGVPPADVAAGRYFLCGPNAFMDVFRAALLEAGVPDERIHTEQFHSTKVTTAGS